MMRRLRRERHSLSIGLPAAPNGTADNLASEEVSCV